MPEPKNDGWGHALESMTIAEDLKELKGFLEGTDKHEQVMEKLKSRPRVKTEPKGLLNRLESVK